MSTNQNLKTTISGLLTVDFQKKSDIFALAKELGIKPIEVNQALKAMSKEGIVEIMDNNGIFVRMSTGSSEPSTVEVSELKTAPGASKVRKILEITEEEAEGLDLELISLRTAPVKTNLVYPKGVTKEMYEEFKSRILNDENKSLLWDFLSNFNGAGGTAITMWNPEHQQANEEGKVFYQWNNPEMTWPLMVQLCKVLDLHEAKKAEEEVNIEE